MSLTLRTITNLAAPLCAPDGTVLANTKVTFTLMNPAGLFIDGWDTFTQERVAGLKTVTTDAQGIFTVALWPTDRGNDVLLYLCHVDSPYFRDFSAALPSASFPLAWVDFMGGTIPLPPALLDALALHVASPTGHPNATPSINGFMAAADKAKLDSLLTSDSVAMTAVAGEAVGGHRAVVIDAAGLAWYADRATADNMNRIAGITQGAAALGGLLTITSKGRLPEPSWSWTPFLPIFLGHNGLLTQTPPTDGFQIVLGTALDATTMFVSPSSPLVII